MKHEAKEVKNAVGNLLYHARCAECGILMVCDAQHMANGAFPHAAAKAHVEETGHCVTVGYMLAPAAVAEQFEQEMTV